MSGHIQGMKLRSVAEIQTGSIDEATHVAIGMPSEAWNVATPTLPTILSMINTTMIVRFPPIAFPNRSSVVDATKTCAS